LLAYVVRRLWQFVPTLLGVAVLVFFMLRVIPGDVVEVKLRGDGGNVSQAAKLAQRNRTEFYKLLQRHSLDPASFKVLAS